MRSLLFLALSLSVPSFLHAQSSGWLAIPEVTQKPEPILVDELDPEAPSSEQLIKWMSSAARHGIDIPQSKWLQLAADPSPQNVRQVAHEYASYLDTGRLKPEVYQPSWHIKDRPSLPVLEDHMSADSLDLVESKLPQYKLFVAALRRLEAWVGSVEKHFPKGLVLEKGDRHPSLLRLNQWLVDLDMADRLPAGSYSSSHEAAIKRVQKKYRIYADGQLGPRARRALVAMTLDRIKVLKVNMERMRWLPRTLPYPHVMVDIAGFNVAWVTSETRKRQFKAIVGKPSRQTPVFQEEIESITINPYWRVPSSIASTSILRKAKKDPGFLKREGFSVYSSWKMGARKVDPSTVNWSQYSRRNFPYRIEQKPGKVNRLGRFKLDSPNAFSIYLHDTDRPELFKRERRTFSSGCTRVENIDQLIGSILRYQGMGSQVDGVLKQKETGRLKLRKKVPLYFVYFTAWPDRHGRIRFRDDIYHLDGALLAKL
ncbi:hypothetical protein EOPP23_19895 [Endozoicomonas sp. OPT23]|uniref:L,D-transpeptidase family protein n=1 Tax=Endozoicomonas sp. OPT23 TaxID=2072845 RepID=UPI00129BE9B8|nr:L,D-transpeptidase family protein [Endozoicomonas sp. OPT23]MRI35235.1 hypothetical protein [Endozoicomonas sp. OPT23]